MVNTLFPKLKAPAKSTQRLKIDKQLQIVKNLCSNLKTPSIVTLHLEIVKWLQPV